MAMLAFCGYNMGDYFAHWLDVGRTVPSPPKVFRVNWFRRGTDGKLLWPGFGENLRVLKWIFERCDGRGQGRETPIGIVPTPDALDLSGLNISDQALEELMMVEPHEWTDASVDQATYFASLGPRVPREMMEEQERMAEALAESQK
jgi:phosphoenolpyruvate carboxykinase (GTP)